MKRDLIDTLFEEFEIDKEIIKQNLIQYLDVAWLEASDEYGKISMIIKYERKEKNENIK